MTGGSRETPPGTRTEHLVVQHNGNRSGEGWRGSRGDLGGAGRGGVEG